MFSVRRGRSVSLHGELSQRLLRIRCDLKLLAVSVSAHLSVVCALIERGGLVLVAQRAAGKSQALLWEFPGGKIEPQEEPEVALVREIREELHVEIIVGERLPDSLHDYGKFAITLVPFVVSLGAGHEPHAAEHAALRWCAPEELRALDWAPADVSIVEHYLARRAGLVSEV